MPKHFLERREVATKERKNLPVLWGCGESVNTPKLNIQEVQVALSSRPKGGPRPTTHFSGFLLLSNFVCF